MSMSVFVLVMLIFFICFNTVIIYYVGKMKGREEGLDYIHKRLDELTRP